MTIKAWILSFGIVLMAPPSFSAYIAGHEYNQLVVLEPCHNTDRGEDKCIAELLQGARTVSVARPSVYIGNRPHFKFHVPLVEFCTGKIFSNYYVKATNGSYNENNSTQLSRVRIHDRKLLQDLQRRCGK